MACPLCGGSMAKVIYLGLPMRLCCDNYCSCLDGVFAVVADWFPISDGSRFAFFAYEGSYLRGLWAWLTHEDGDF